MSSIPLFLFITWLGPAARAVSAPVMSSASACCLLALSCDVIHRRHSLRLSLFAPHRLAPRPACRVGGRGADGAACLPHDVVARGVALVSWPCLGCGAVPWFICRASVVLPVLLLLMRWRRGTGTDPMRYDGSGGCLSNEGMAT